MQSKSPILHRQPKKKQETTRCTRPVQVQKKDKQIMNYGSTPECFPVVFFVPLCTPGASSGLLFLLVHPFNVLSHGKIMAKNGRVLLGFQSLQVHKTSAFYKVLWIMFHENALSHGGVGYDRGKGVISSRRQVSQMEVQRAKEKRILPAPRWRNGGFVCWEHH